MSYDRSLDLMCLKRSSLDEDGKFPVMDSQLELIWSGSLHTRRFTKQVAKIGIISHLIPSLKARQTSTSKVEGRPCGLIATHLGNDKTRPQRGTHTDS